LSSAESTFAKVQSIGKIGNERCAELSSRIETFVQNYEMAREEVNAALALVTAGGDSPLGTATEVTGTVQEAMELEASAEEHLRAAREANRDFQRQRKAVRELAVDAWDQLVAIAKVIRFVQ
jgi:hypothetical protein